MKILFSWTGVTSYMADCWRCLRQLPGVELRVVVEQAYSGRDFAAEQTLQGLDYLVVDQSGRDERLGTFLQDYVPEVIFAGGWRSLTTGAVLDRYKEIPKIFCLDMPWRWSLRCLAARWVLRNFVKRFEAVYVPGPSAAFYAQWLGFKRIHRKLYAVNRRKFKIADGGIGNRKREGFLFVGRYSPEKRRDVIERAYAEYRKCGGKWSIDYYGQGGKFVQAEGMPQVYAEHACLVLASAFDPWPLVMLEARMAGLEVIASDRCGNCEELGAHKVPYGEVKALARKMLAVEQGAVIPLPPDLDDYDCAAWASRTLKIAATVAETGLTHRQD